MGMCDTACKGHLEVHGQLLEGVLVFHSLQHPHCSVHVSMLQQTVLLTLHNQSPAVWLLCSPMQAAQHIMASHAHEVSAATMIFWLQCLCKASRASNARCFNIAASELLMVTATMFGQGSLADDKFVSRNKLNNRCCWYCCMLMVSLLVCSIIFMKRLHMALQVAYITKASPNFCIKVIAGGGSCHNCGLM